MTEKRYHVSINNNGYSKLIKTLEKANLTKYIPRLEEDIVKDFENNIVSYMRKNHNEFKNIDVNRYESSLGTNTKNDDPETNHHGESFVSKETNTQIRNLRLHCFLYPLIEQFKTNIPQLAQEIETHDELRMFNKIGNNYKLNEKSVFLTKVLKELYKNALFDEDTAKSFTILALDIAIWIIVSTPLIRRKTNFSYYYDISKQEIITEKEYDNMCELTNDNGIQIWQFKPDQKAICIFWSDNDTLSTSNSRYCVYWSDNDSFNISNPRYCKIFKNNDIKNLNYDKFLKDKCQYRDCISCFYEMHQILRYLNPNNKTNEFKTIEYSSRDTIYILKKLNLNTDPNQYTFSLIQWIKKHWIICFIISSFIILLIKFLWKSFNNTNIPLPINNEIILPVDNIKHDAEFNSMKSETEL